MNRFRAFLRLAGSARDNEFPGDHTGGETPVPIPNTEAKLVGPMVVRQRESRLSPGFIKAEEVILPGLCFLRGEAFKA